MPRTVTLGNILERARQRADMVGTDVFITDAAWKMLLDTAYAELVDLLIKHELHQFETTQTITSTGTNTYALSSDHYKTLGMDYLRATGVYEEVPEVTFAQRNLYNSLNSLSGSPMGYRLVGANVVFYPAPPTGQVFRHTYVPAPASIAALADATAIDGVAGWDEYMVIHSAINAKIRERSDTRDLERKLVLLKERIAQAGVDREPPRAIGETHFAGDLERDSWWPWNR
jgi:hypothetical protein